MGLVVIVACDDPSGRALLADLERLPGLSVEGFPTLDAARDTAKEGKATVLVTCPAVPVPDAIAESAGLLEAGSDIATVIVTDEITTEVLRAAMRGSVRDALSASDGVDAIVAAVVAADEAVSRRRAQEPAPAAEEAKPAPLGRVVTVFSTKGGVGKSVVATNLAVTLAGTGASVILADLDLQFGDVSVMLQIPPERTIYDAVQSFDRLDAEMLRGFLTKHDSGLSTLLAPVQPEQAESCTSARISHIIQLLRQMASYVVIDTPASLSEVVLTALEQSDVILAVATMDVPSVKNTKVSLQKLRQLGFDNGTVRLVLNRADSKVWLEPHEIEKVISDRIVARIPSDRIVPRSVNKGVPVVLDAPKSAVARSIQGLAHAVTGS